MARILPGFRQLFEYVLLDVPPCLEFADARIVGRYVETILLVVRAGYTERQSALAAVERLRLDGTPVMGVIVNGCDAASNDPHRYAEPPREFA
jgi:receptor protein-tyrosine kinase